MNKLSLLLAGLLGAATLSAQAGELYAPTTDAVAPSTLTRAEVRQSVLAARWTGQAAHNDVDLPGNGTLMSDEPAFGKTRASVKADVLAARTDGELDHNDVDLPNVAQGSVLTRRDVRSAAISSRSAVKTAPGRNTIDY